MGAKGPDLQSQTWDGIGESSLRKSSAVRAGAGRDAFRRVKTHSWRPPLQGQGRKTCSVLQSVETQGLWTGGQTTHCSQSIRAASLASLPRGVMTRGPDGTCVHNGCTTGDEPPNYEARSLYTAARYLSLLPSGTDWERNLYSLMETHDLPREEAKVLDFLLSLESKLTSPGKGSLSIPPERNTIPGF